MMRTKLNSWLRRTVMHGAMDLALQATEVNAYCYDGQDGRRRLNADVADASEAVHTARDLTPAWAHPDLDRALRHIDTAMTGDDVDSRLYAMLDAAAALRRAHQSLLVRCADYRAQEITP